MFALTAKFAPALAAALALAACGSGGQSLFGATQTQLPLADPEIGHAAGPAARSKEHLYVASANPYFVNEYTLPLRSDELPLRSLTNVNEPVPVFDDGSDLYVGSFNDGSIYVFPLPLAAYLAGSKPSHYSAYVEPFSRTDSASLTPPLPAAPGSIASGLDDLSGLTVEDGFLYVAGAGGRHATVLAYRLPLFAGEKPSGSISTFSPFDFLGVAARNGTLFVESTIEGSVAAYTLPLGRKERPEFTIPTVPQNDGAAGIAVDASARHLYVALYRTGAVYEYRLPYVTGETPRRLDVENQTGGLPYGIALDATHLFVTANGIAAYALPITSHSQPGTILPLHGSASGIAAGR